MFSVLSNVRTALVLAALCSPQWGNAQDLTIGLWGGDFATKYDNSVLKGWRNETGERAQVQDFYAGGALDASNAAAAMNGFDVVALSGETERLLCEAGQLAKITDGSDVDLSHMTAAANCGVPFISYGQTIVYSAGAPEKPRGVDDFFDVADFPGARGLYDTPKGVLEMALLAKGVAPEDIYPMLETDDGLVQAYEKLNQIKSNVVWFDTSSAEISALSSGDLAMALTWTDDFNRAAEARAYLQATPDFMLVEHEYLAVPIDRARNPSATDFVDFATSPKGLTILDEALEGLYSVPSDALKRNPGDDPTLVLACPQNACPCAGPSGGCHKSCCNDLDGFAGHFEIDEGFWSLNQERLNQSFQDWRSN